MSATLRTFSTPDRLFDAMFGPRQHDAHVETRRRFAWLAERHATLDDADARVRATAAEINAAYRSRLPIRQQLVESGEAILPTLTDADEVRAFTRALEAVS